MRHAILLLAAAGLACSRGPAPDSAAQGPAAVRVSVGFVGEVDPVTGTLTLRAPGRPASRRLLVEVPVVQDGVVGSGPANTIELVTEAAASETGGCGAVDAFAGTVRVRSFFSGMELRNTYVEIQSVSGVNHEACNSAAPVSGLSSQYGLFGYGTLGRAGGGHDTAVATWRFRKPGEERFTFVGRVVADEVTVATTPAAQQVASGHFASSPRFHLEGDVGEPVTGSAASSPRYRLQGGVTGALGSLP